MVTVERAGLMTLEIFLMVNIRNFGGSDQYGLTSPRKKIKNTNTVWAQALKLSNQPTQAASPQAKGSSFKPESTSSSIPEPGYKR